MVVEMATKVVYTVREDKQEIPKQLGCMNGIFQLFDRRYLLGQHRHGRNQRRQPPGQSDEGEREFKNASQKAKEKTPRKVTIEKNRASIESSRNSFSSSCSSTTFSSFDCSKRVQTEHSEIIFEPMSPNLHKKQPDFSLQPPDIRDVVKNAMSRQTRVVSVRTVAKDERASPAMKHIDSPRPFVHQKPIEQDRKDQNFAKLQETSWGVKDLSELSRFSCDERELQCSLTSGLKVKELPRLSLDSKQNSMNGLRRSLLIQKILEGQTLNQTVQTHELGSNKRPSSSVVARLMGLESLRDSIDEVETSKIKHSSDDELVSRSRWLRKGDEFRQTHQEGGNRSSKKPPLKHKEAPVRSKMAAGSVYGEMEKRLTELEFKTSRKDLRALKRILEAMQTTMVGLDNKGQSPASPKNGQPVSPTVKGTRSPKRHELLNAAMKPAKTTTDYVIVSGRALNKKAQRSLLPEYLTGEKSRVSPRRQWSKNGVDQQSNHGPSSDLSRTKKQPNMKHIVSGLKTKNAKTKPVNPLQNNKQSCRCSIETRSLNQDGDTVSFKSEINTSLPSQNELEVARTDNHRNNFAEKLTEDKPIVELPKLTMEQPSPVSVLDAFFAEDTPSPVKNKPNSFNDYENSHFDETEWNQMGIYNLVKSTDLDQFSEFSRVNLENQNQLLDQIKLTNSNDNEATESYLCESKNGDHRCIRELLLATCFLNDLDYATRIVQLHPTSTLINPELFHALEKTKECTELTDDQYHKKNTQYEKIKRKMVFDAMNDILFRKLAAMSGSLWTGKRQVKPLNGEKLLKELCSELDDLQTSSDRCIYYEDDEVNALVTDDVNKKSEDWDEFRYEVPSLVLDIERLIFKDLIKEVVNSEVASLQDWSGTHCRQLFPI